MCCTLSCLSRSSPSLPPLPPSHSGGGVNYYYLCSSGIDPVTPWYQYIFDFVLGKGIFNDTVLFHGRYTNESVQTLGRVSYNLPQIGRAHV